MSQDKLEQIIKEEVQNLLKEKCWPGYEKKGMKTMFGKRVPNCVKKTNEEAVEEGWKDIAMAGGMALGSLLPGQDAAAATPKEPTTQVRQATDPLLIDDSKWDTFQLADLFLNPRGGLSMTGQKELLSLNQLDDSGKLTDKANLERKTLFKNPQVAPLQLSADDLIGAIMDPRPVKR